MKNNESKARKNSVPQNFACFLSLSLLKERTQSSLKENRYDTGCNALLKKCNRCWCQIYVALWHQDFTGHY